MMRKKTMTASAARNEYLFVKKIQWLHGQQALENLIVYLASRWRDESGYESPEQYEKVLLKMILELMNGPKVYLEGKVTDVLGKPKVVQVPMIDQSDLPIEVSVEMVKRKSTRTFSFLLTAKFVPAKQHRRYQKEIERTYEFKLQGNTYSYQRVK